MKQNENNIDCAPSKDEEGVAKCSQEGKEDI